MYQSVFIALTAALAATAAPTVNNADAIKIPLLNRRAPVIQDAAGNVNMAAFLNEIDHVLVKHGAQGLFQDSKSTADLLSKRNNLPLTDQVESGEDELYYGSGTVGTQTFTFDFDTGSSDLFVPGPSCTSAQGCPGTTKYNQKGTDEKNTTSVTYGSGAVSGENYFDKVTIAGLTADKQNVISLTTAQGFASSQSDGLLGMAFQSIANSGQPPFFQTLISEGKVTSKEFAFYLGRAQSKTQGASELALGGRDTSKYTGAVTTVPVTSQTYWQVAVDALTVNGKSAGPTTKGAAAIDTGTTIILAPTIAAAAFFAQIPGAIPLPLVSGNPIITLYAYPCGYSGTVAIQFAGKQFKINPLDFNFGTLVSNSAAESLGSLMSPSELASLQKAIANAGASGLCLAGLAGGDIDPTQNLYVVGDTFLKNWYSIYSFVAAKGAPAVLFAAAAGNQ